jgi:hypothetical protein
MTDFSVRSDSVDVEQIMTQIRARIREKRGVDYTEEEIRELANVKLEKFFDPHGVRSDLLEQFRRSRAAMPPPPNYAFEDTTIFETHRAVLRWIRGLLRPILKLFFNPNPIAQALHIQAELNTRNAEREGLDTLRYEVMHNLVLELTRLGIEVKNLRMQVESMSSRLDFDERRARALEGVVVYRPGSVAPLQPPTGAPDAPSHESEQSERRTRRRRRRGRRKPDGMRPGSENQSGAPASPSPQSGEGGPQRSDFPGTSPEPRGAEEHGGEGGPVPPKPHAGESGEGG